MKNSSSSFAVLANWTSSVWYSGIAELGASGAELGLVFRNPSAGSYLDFPARASSFEDPESSRLIVLALAAQVRRILHLSDARSPYP